MILNRIVNFTIDNFPLVILFSFAIGYIVGNETHQCPPCGETFPKEITEAFIFKNDTLFVKQGTNFTISTETVMVDTTGMIYRNR